MYKNVLVPGNKNKDLQSLLNKNISNCFNCTKAQCSCGKGDIYLNELIKEITNKVLIELEEKK